MDEIGDIGSLAISCAELFDKLTTSLPNSTGLFKRQMPPGAIENEHARFKIWSGNLGALQRGRSSLDARTRDSVVLRATVLKFLGQLRDCLIQSIEVVDGHRLPYEQQPASDFEEDDSDTVNHDEDAASTDHFSDSSSESEIEELAERLSEIKDVVEHLYRLSFKIRSTRYRSLTKKPLLLKEEDQESGRDLFSAYAAYDLCHVQESLSQLRTFRSPSTFEAESSRPPDHIEMDLLDTDFNRLSTGDYLVGRLAKAITDRRRYFTYWQRHALKLSHSANRSLVQRPGPEAATTADRKGQLMDQQVSTSALEMPFLASKTDIVPSETDVSMYNRELDDLLDAETVISYATTARDTEGKSAELPSPPVNTADKLEFLCPYCWIVCPSREGRGRLWQEHIRHDLQPYICTYEECPDAEIMYNSRHAWLEHERLVHRRVWRCFEHTTFIVKAKNDLLKHFEESHTDMKRDQIESHLNLAETTTVDDRQVCPFCYSVGPFDKGLPNHIAFHQEQLATFAAPRNLDSTGEADSKQAQGFKSRGSLSSITFDSTSSYYSLGNEVDEFSRDRANKLLRAVKCGDIEVASGILLQTDDVNTDVVDSDGETSLYHAARVGYVPLVQLLLKRGANINFQGGYYGNALQAASHAGRKEIVQILLQNGADVNAKGGHYGSALQAALVVASKASTDQIGSDSYSPSLTMAIKGYEEIVQMLLDGGADINAQGGYYGNALQVASAGRFMSTVELLLNRGAKVDAQGGYHHTALLAAIAEGYQGNVFLLFAAGADVNLRGGFHGNALQQAFYARRPEIVQALLDHGADVHASRSFYCSASAAASNKNLQEMVDILKKAGADVIDLDEEIAK